jgi:hypothetical protein
LTQALHVEGYANSATAASSGKLMSMVLAGVATPEVVLSVSMERLRRILASIEVDVFGGMDF